MDFRSPIGQLTIADPNFLQEFYTTKNKYYDNHERLKEMFYDFLRESFVMAKTTEITIAKRKSVSSAFYKSKMMKMLNIVIKITNDKAD